MKPIRVLLVDDQPAVRRGLRMRLALESDLEVVAEAADGEAAVATATEFRPDVVLMDIEMPGRDGIGATRDLRLQAPACAVVVLSIHDDSATKAAARDAGAAAFVAKHEAGDRLLDAIRSAAAARDEKEEDTS